LSKFIAETDPDVILEFILAIRNIVSATGAFLNDEEIKK